MCTVINTPLSNEAKNTMSEMIHYLEKNQIHYFKFNDYLLHFTICNTNEQPFIGLFEIDDRHDPSGLYIVCQIGLVYGTNDKYHSIYDSIMKELRDNIDVYPNVIRFMLY